MLFVEKLLETGGRERRGMIKRRKLKTETVRRGRERREREEGN